MPQYERLDADLVRKLGVQLEPGGIAKVQLVSHASELGELPSSLNEVLAAIQQGQATFQVEKYFHFAVLHSAADRLLANAAESQSRIDLVPVIFLQAAALECLVNDLVIDWCQRQYGVNGRSITECLLDGSVKSRLLRIVPLFTHGRLVLDSQAPSIKSATRLILFRNRLVHMTEYFAEAPSATVNRPSLLSTLSVDEAVGYQFAVGEIIEVFWNVLRKGPPWEHPWLLGAERPGDIRDID